MARTRIGALSRRFAGSLRRAALERLVELVGVAAAGLGDLGFAAATAADYRRRLADDVGRREPALDRGGAEDCRRARPCPPLGAAEHDGGVAERAT